MGGGPKEPFWYPTFWMRPRENPGAMAHSVNPNLDQRMSHMHFYDKKKIWLNFVGQDTKNPSHFYSSNLFYKFIYIVLKKIIFTFQKNL